MPQIAPIACPFTKELRGSFDNLEPKSCIGPFKGNAWGRSWMAEQNASWW